MRLYLKGRAKKIWVARKKREETITRRVRWNWWSKHDRLALSSYIYKKLKQLKLFLIKIRPTLPLTEAPLVMPKNLTKMRGRLISSIFSIKILILITPAISYTHLLYRVLLFFAHTLLSFAYAFTHIHVIIYFESIIIDIIIYGRKIKMCIIF